MVAYVLVCWLTQDRMETDDGEEQMQSMPQSKDALCRHSSSAVSSLSRRRTGV